MQPASWAEKVTAQQDGSENWSKFASRIFKDTWWTEMRVHIPCHISTTHFSPQQQHLAEKIRTRIHFDKGNRCYRNVNNKQERLDLDLIILIKKQAWVTKPPLLCNNNDTDTWIVFMVLSQWHSPVIYPVHLTNADSTKWPITLRPSQLT